MKKLLGILVLGLSVALLNSCSNTAHIPGYGNISIAHGCKWNDEPCNWRVFKNLDYRYYKIWGEVLGGQYIGQSTWAATGDGLNRALGMFHAHPLCKTGCIVSYIGNNKITKTKQTEIAEEYLPPGMFKKYFDKPVKKGEKQKKEKEEEKKKEEDQLVKEENEKEEEKTEKKEADVGWF